MIVCCGAAIVDLVPEPIPGGSNMNVAVTAARLGAPTAFLGRLSLDSHGDLLMAHMQSSGIDTRLVERGSEPTATASVVYNPTPTYFFDADGTAEANLGSADLSPLGAGPHIIHGGTLGMFLGRTARILGELVEATTGLVSLDPNVRPDLIESRGEWDAWHGRWLRHASLYRCSDEDLAWIWPNRSPDSIASELLAGRAEMVIVTRGAEGYELFNRNWHVRRPAPQVEVVDTVGAGDSFTGTVLAGLHAIGAATPELVSGVDQDTWQRITDRAALVSAIVCSRMGADPPWAHEADSTEERL